MFTCCSTISSLGVSNRRQRRTHVEVDNTEMTDTMSTFRIGYAGAAGGHEVRSGHEQEERGLGLELVARQSTPTGMSTIRISRSRCQVGG